MAPERTVTSRPGRQCIHSRVMPFSLSLSLPLDLRSSYISRACQREASPSQAVAPALSVAAALTMAVALALTMAAAPARC